MNIKNMKIGSRLSVGFGLVLLMMTINITIALLRFSSVGEINSNMIEKDWVKADAANSISVLARDNARNSLELLIATDQAKKEEIGNRVAATRKKIGEAIQILDALVFRAEGKDLLEKIKKVRAQYVISIAKVGKLVSEGKRDEAISLMNAETLPILDALQEPVNALAKFQKTIVAASSADLQQAIGTARTLMIALGLAAALSC